MHPVVAAAVFLAAAPLAAQDNSSVSLAPPPAAENIGPRELSNFSLNGTVTRSAEPAAVAPNTAKTAPQREAAAPPPPASSAPRESAPVRATNAGTREAPAERQAALDPITSRPTLRQPSASTSTGAVAAPALTTPLTDTAAPASASGGFSPLPWIAALLLFGAGAVVYFGLQRRRQRFAAAGPSQYFEAPREPPSAPTPVPRPAPQEPLVRRAGPETSGPAGVVTSSLRAATTLVGPPGLVTSSLRPWIEVELEPSQALVTDEHAAIAFDVTLYNSGSAPARDIAVEACMFNASQQQDAQLSEFYTMDTDVPDKIPSVAPMAKVTLKSAVRMPRSAVQEYEVEGRKLFMPMVAINSRYRWSSGEGQSAVSFMVGKAANDSARLAPLRLDQGSRGWKALAARRYEKGIRR